jgi:hypothetical protein
LFSVVSSLGITTAGWAAETTYVDPVGVCNGSTPCFTTIQAAVDNAGPGAATVFIFPGTYPENVDVATMGSAIGGGLADLTLQALDATGTPAISGVVVDPGAPGGSGTGIAISALPAPDPLPMSLAMLGIEATSPDATAIAGVFEGTVTVDHVTASNSGSDGLVLAGAAGVTAQNLIADSNQGVGMALVSGAGLTAEDLFATANAGDGIVLGAMTSVVGTSLGASANLNGLLVSTCGSLTLDTPIAVSNTDRGLWLQGYDPQDLACQETFPPVVLVTPLAPDLPLPIAESAAPLEVLISHPSGGGLPAVLTDGFASGNGGYGMFALLVGPTTVANTTISGNDEAGLVLLGEDVLVTDSIFSQNASGALVGGLSSVTMTHSSASMNGGGGTDPLFDGLGFLTSSPSVTLTDLSSSDNLVAGLAMNGISGMPSVIRVEGGAFSGNDRGITSQFAIEGLDLTLADVSVTANQVGISAPFVDNLMISNSTLEGNAVALVATLSENLLATGVDFRANGTGAQLELLQGADATIRCSNFTANTSATGLQLFSGGEVGAGNNFWDSQTGPTHPDNPAGQGEAVVDTANGGAGTVVFAPYLDELATPDNCGVGPVIEVPMDRSALVLLMLLLASMSVLVISKGGT